MCPVCLCLCVYVCVSACVCVSCVSLWSPVVSACIRSSIHSLFHPRVIPLREKFDHSRHLWTNITLRAERKLPLATDVCCCSASRFDLIIVVSPCVCLLPVFHQVCATTNQLFVQIVQMCGCCSSGPSSHNNNLYARCWSRDFTFECKDGWLLFLSPEIIGCKIYQSWIEHWTFSSALLWHISSTGISGSLF